jgi:hypothetical protein
MVAKELKCGRAPKRTTASNASQMVCLKRADRNPRVATQAKTILFG